MVVEEDVDVEEEVWVGLKRLASRGPSKNFSSKISQGILELCLGPIL